MEKNHAPSESNIGSYFVLNMRFILDIRIANIPEELYSPPSGNGPDPVPLGG
jgi:hypothetical protein